MKVSKLKYESIRYIFAEAKNGNEDAKKLVEVLVKGKRGVGYKSLIEQPYSSNSNIVFALTTINETLESVDKEWYRYITDDICFKYFVWALTTYNEEVSYSVCIAMDEDVVKFLTAKKRVLY